MQSFTRLALLPIAALALGSCAAAALPALAGGAMLRSGSSGGGQGKAIPEEADQGDASLAFAPVPASGPAIGKPLSGEYASFARFARNKARSARIDPGTTSAVLRNPGMLDGERSQCGDFPAAVLIDLDDEGGVFEPHDAYQSPTDLSADLASLREAGISVAWISAAKIDQYGAVRYALMESGLDPAGNDQLLLIEHDDERKQTRREAFAKSHCIVAIAGDSMADFDELFLFLTNPDAATPLNAMVGDGWFITPLALTKR